MRGITITRCFADRSDKSVRAYLREVSRFKPVSREREIELFKRIRQGDRGARDEILKAHLKFVVTVAKKYQNYGLPLVDLIQEGNMGLFTAIEKFDETRGTKFITYAVRRIKASIMRAITEKTGAIRRDLSFYNSIAKIDGVTWKFKQETGCEPSIHDLEARTRFSATKINDTFSTMMDVVSLDSELCDGCEDRLIDVIENEDADDPVGEMFRVDRSEKIEYVLSKLSPRNSDIIRMCFGIGMEPMTTRQVGEYFGIGAERVKQVKNKTLKYMRKRYSKYLDGLL